MRRRDVRLMREIALYLEVPYYDISCFLNLEFPGCAINSQLSIVNNCECRYRTPDGDHGEVTLQKYEFSGGSEIWITYIPEIDTLVIKDDGYLRAFVDTEGI